jgi:hypothetical protein
MKLKLNATCIYHQKCLQLHYIEHQKQNLKHIQTPTFSNHPKQILHPYKQHVGETSWVVIL